MHIKCNILHIEQKRCIFLVEGRAMKIDKNMNEKAILQELAARFKQTRIDAGMTREELADRSMVSVRTIARYESGNDISFENMIKLMKAMELEVNFNELIPDVFDRPSYHVEKAVVRKRAGKSRKKSDWKWGDEQ